MQLSYAYDSIINNTENDYCRSCANVLGDKPCKLAPAMSRMKFYRARPSAGTVCPLLFWSGYSDLTGKKTSSREKTIINEFVVLWPNINRVMGAAEPCQK